MDQSLADQPLRRFGPILLAPGITPGHATTYFMSATVGILLVLCVNLLQPYMLQETLAIPRDKQGGLTGALAFFQEIIILLTVMPLGWLADRIGRRPIFVMGFVLFALGFFLYPLAENQRQLFEYRFIIALGAAAYSIGLFSTSADYPINEHRGKWTMVMTLVQGFTASLIAGPYLAKLPQLFSERGATAMESAQYAFWLIAALAALAAFFMRFGLAGPSLERHQARSPWREMVSTGIAAARTNPRIAVSYAGAFATRGDFVIIASFLMLWVTQAGISQGLPTGEALAKAGFLFGLSQLSATLWSLVMGPLLDRIDRLTGLMLSMAIATVCYLHMFFITDPLGTHMLIAALLLGIAEMSTIVAGQVLITQEAPAEHRGRIVGVFTFFGALGILTGSAAGGFLFDAWHPSGPFVFMGFVNLGVFVWAWRIRRRELKQVPAAIPMADGGL